MICRAIINTEEEIGLPKHLGKKKLKECRRRMNPLDKYTLVCPLGHRKRTQDWNDKSFLQFKEEKADQK